VADGRRLRFDKAQAVRTAEALAAGRVGEAELADWFRERLD
jgi:death on curing protein